MSSSVTEICQNNAYHPRGLLLQWHITDRCNLRCAHCYQENYAGKELAFPELLRILRQYLELLERWRSQAGGTNIRGHINVTGGEPFARRDFFDLLEVFATERKRFSFAILSNGSFIDAGVARRLRLLRPAFVQVSIEGVQATHDRIRGPGTFERTVAAIQCLVRQGIRTLISFTAQRGNFREFLEVCRLGQRLGVAKVWADRMIPWGSGAAGQVLTPEETREFCLLLWQARVERKRRWFVCTEIASHRALQFLMGGGRPYHCSAGDSLLAVLPNGEVLPCRRLPIMVGNALETPLTAIYYENAWLRALREHSGVSRGCEQCYYSRLCRGGLKCLAYALTGDPFIADPGCWHATCRGAGSQADSSGVLRVGADSGLNSES
ncbi:MAG: radical SAM protein [Candidatus Competibacteraceae bacterium]